ncbi:hypothetical protein CRYUN_Cryun31cG0031100 [Craigia yunnanensis]
MRPRLLPHLNQRWRQLSLKLSQWSDGYPKTTFRRPPVTHPTPLATSHLFTLITLSASLSICNFVAFSLSTPTPLNHLTRFSYFFHTWTHPTGSILHPHDLLEPDFVFTTNTKQEHTQSALSSTLSDHQHYNPLDSLSHRTFVLMENSYIPFFPTTTTTTNTTLRQPNMGWSQNSEFSVYEPMNSKNLSSAPLTTASNFQFHHPSQFVAPYQSQQLPYRHPIEQAGHSLAYPVYPFFLRQNGIEFGVSSSIHASNGAQGSRFMQTDGLSKEQERRILDPYKTKVARIKRKLARQRSLSLQRNASSGASTQVDARRLTSSGANTDMNNNNETKRDLYKFCTPDNKRLRVLLRKELKNSDVGSLGRIVLPKREAEVNLPTLSDKEGIQIMIKDVYSNQVWTLKYKFWSNNKSRMYVLENTGDFVKQNGLEIGDSLGLYEDESKNLVQRIDASNNQQCDNVNNNNNHMYLPFTCQSRDEEETSLELLIEQLKHKEQQEPNDFMTLPMDAAYSHRPPEEARHFLSDSFASRETYGEITATTLQTSSTSLQGKARSVDDIQINFDDCYGGLDMLPDVNHYNFSL